MTMHQSAKGFEQAAGAYERGRPTYPKEAVDLIVGQLSIGPSSTVVDLAAGTGKFTRLLVSTGARIIAIEPVEGMRAQLEQQVPGIEVLEGTAESLPLTDASVDAVTVAQSFHWFRGDEAVEEIYRVLRPGGGLALIWNRRDLTRPLQQAVQEIVAPHRGETPAHAAMQWREAFERTALFTRLEERQIPHEQVVDAEGLVDRVASTSFIANLPDETRGDVLARVRDLPVDLPERFPLHYVTDVYWCYVQKETDA